VEETTPTTVSQLLASLAAERTRKLSIEHILEAFGDRAFGALLFVFAAPIIVPLPPGVSALLGAPLLFVTSQWMLGRSKLWLPQAIRRRSISMSDYRSLLEKLAPHLEKLERRLRPRLRFLFNRIGDRIAGAVCFLLALIVFMPIPFGNMLPSLAIAAFGIGSFARDGVAVLFGWVAALLSIAVLVLLSQAIWAGVVAFVSTVAEIF